LVFPKEEESGGRLTKGQDKGEGISWGTRKAAFEKKGLKCKPKHPLANRKSAKKEGFCIWGANKSPEGLKR